MRVIIAGTIISSIIVIIMLAIGVSWIHKRWRQLTDILGRQWRQSHNHDQNQHQNILVRLHMQKKEVETLQLRRELPAVADATLRRELPALSNGVSRCSGARRCARRTHPGFLHVGARRHVPLPSLRVDVERLGHGTRKPCLAST